MSPHVYDSLEKPIVSSQTSALPKAFTFRPEFYMSKEPDSKKRLTAPDRLPAALRDAFRRLIPRGCKGVFITDNLKRKEARTYTLYITGSNVCLERKRRQYIFKFDTNAVYLNTCRKGISTYRLFSGALKWILADIKRGKSRIYNLK